LYFELRGAFFLFLAEKFLILLQRDSVWQETFLCGKLAKSTRHPRLTFASRGDKLDVLPTAARKKWHTSLAVT
jgi:hypothetical protein